MLRADQLSVTDNITISITMPRSTLYTNDQNMHRGTTSEASSTSSEMCTTLSLPCDRRNVSAVGIPYDRPYGLTKLQYMIVTCETRYAGPRLQPPLASN